MWAGVQPWQAHGCLPEIQVQPWADPPVRGSGEGMPVPPEPAGGRCRAGKGDAAPQSSPPPSQQRPNGDRAVWARSTPHSPTARQCTGQHRSACPMPWSITAHFTKHPNLLQGTGSPGHSSSCRPVLAGNSSPEAALQLGSSLVPQTHYGAHTRCSKLIRQRAVHGLGRVVTTAGIQWPVWRNNLPWSVHTYPRVHQLPICAAPDLPPIALSSDVGGEP